MTSLVGAKTPETAGGAALQAALGDLEEALRAVLGAAQELEPVLREKQQVLVANRTDRLEPLVRREGEISARLAELEFQRQIRTLALAQPLGLDPAELRLSDVLDAASGAAGLEGVNTVALDLARQLERLEQLNADNALLSNNLLQYTQFVLQLMHDGTAQPGYRSNGKVAPAAAGGRELLDYRV